MFSDILPLPEILERTEESLRETVNGNPGGMIDTGYRTSSKVPWRSMSSLPSLLGTAVTPLTRSTRHGERCST